MVPGLDNKWFSSMHQWGIIHTGLKSKYCKPGGIQFTAQWGVGEVRYSNDKD